jgi:topoisomerase IA-like protein
MTVSLEQATALLAERAAKGGGKKRPAPKVRKTAKSASEEKVVIKKPAKVAKRKPEPVAGE